MPGSRDPLRSRHEVWRTRSVCSRIARSLAAVNQPTPGRARTSSEETKAEKLALMRACEFQGCSLNRATQSRSGPGHTLSSIRPVYLSCPRDLSDKRGLVDLR